jgi:hypothetical protein
LSLGRCTTTRKPQDIRVTPDPTQPEPVLVLVRDLIFASRIQATANAAAVSIRLIRDPSQLLPATPGRKTIVDLNLEGAISAAAEWKKATGRPVIGFVSHVDAATAAQARQAGIDQILARSRFVDLLPTLLKE